VTTAAPAPHGGATTHAEPVLALMGAPGTAGVGRREMLPESRPVSLVPGAPAVPGYTIVEKLGAGGMGVVYLAVPDGLPRPEVIKTLRTGVDSSEDELRRFQAEAEAVARLRHENIVQIHRVEAAPGPGRVPYIVLEYLEGGSLDKRIAGTPRPAREAAGLVEKVARAVRAAHAAGIVHRDLKPSNVLLTADGTPKVTDFGIAKRLDDVGQTRTGSVLGTPSYMAPEQARGDTKRVGPAADVYGLGAVLYELLTGRPPFRGESTAATLRQVLTTDPVSPRALNPSVPRDLETICLKCLAKEPEKRYAAADEMADDLRRFLKSEPILARPPGLGVRFRLWCRRPERVHDAGAFMVFLGIVSTLWTLSGIAFVATGVMTPREPAAALIQLAAFLVLFYFPIVLIGLRTMARRPVWIWLGAFVVAGDLGFCVLSITASGVVQEFSDVGGLHDNPNVRYPVFSLLGILSGFLFFGYCVALVSYYSNPDAVE
jgi:hypothetical protein